VLVDPPLLVMQGNTLVQVHFLDIPQMVSSLACVKDYLLLGQLGHSLAFLRYTLSREQRSTWVAGCTPLLAGSDSSRLLGNVNCSVSCFMFHVSCVMTVGLHW
jgi:hypothetical protein